MGQNKAFMLLGHKPVIQHVLTHLSTVFEEVMISGSPAAYGFLRPCISDTELEKGPMGGICAALAHCEEAIFVCSCDMPFVSENLINWIIEQQVPGKINCIQYRGKVYPTLGIYPISVLPALRKAIVLGQLRMTNFLIEQDAHYIQCLGDMEVELLNINTPANFQQAEQLLNK